MVKLFWQNNSYTENGPEDAKEIYDQKMQEPIPPPDPKIFTQSVCGNSKKIHKRSLPSR